MITSSGFVELNDSARIVLTKDCLLVKGFGQETLKPISKFEAVAMVRSVGTRIGKIELRGSYYQATVSSRSANFESNVVNIIIDKELPNG